MALNARGVIAIAALSSAVISGGWLMHRGMLGASHQIPPVDGRELYGHVFTTIRDRYVAEIPEDSLYQLSVRGVIDELGDPHSQYLPADRRARLDETTSGQYVGIGAEVDARDGWVTILSVFPDGPAKEAGIQPGDRFAEVEGRSAAGWTSEEAVRALRGPAGSSVRFSMDRPGAGRLPFTLTRRAIRVHPVQHARMIRPTVGYVDVLVFAEGTARELRRAVDSLRTAGARAMIIDLRGDPGGLLTEGVAVTDLFLDRGDSIVSIRGHGMDPHLTYTDSAAQPWKDLMVAVLVDGASASASEIVAGALQDHDRAVVLGTRTFGKGSAQGLFNVADGAGVKLTVARWFTPLGRSIERVADSSGQRASQDSDTDAPQYRTPAGRLLAGGGGGITPDLAIVDSARPIGELALQRAVGTRVREFREELVRYATSLKGSAAVASPMFVVTPTMRQELLRRLAERGIKVDSASAAVPVLDRMMGTQIARELYGSEAGFGWGLTTDPVVQRAITVFEGARTQAELFDRVDRSKR
jgi:carboxyl-terminal processing protease